MSVFTLSPLHCQSGDSVTQGEKSREARICGRRGRTAFFKRAEATGETREGALADSGGSLERQGAVPSLRETAATEQWRRHGTLFVDEKKIRGRPHRRVPRLLAGYLPQDARIVAVEPDLKRKGFVLTLCSEKFAPVGGGVRPSEFAPSTCGRSRATIEQK